MHNRKWVPGVPIQIEKGPVCSSREAFFTSVGIVVMIALAIALAK